jgi:hypothetical protein
MKSFRTTLNYLAFGAAFAGCFYTLIYLGTNAEPVSPWAEVAHKNNCAESKAEHCKGVAAK